jgi:hypothetical protein
METCDGPVLVATTVPLTDTIAAAPTACRASPVSARSTAVSASSGVSSEATSSIGGGRAGSMRDDAGGHSPVAGRTSVKFN